MKPTAPPWTALVESGVIFVAGLFAIFAARVGSESERERAHDGALTAFDEGRFWEAAASWGRVSGDGARANRAAALLAGGDDPETSVDEIAIAEELLLDLYACGHPSGALGLAIAYRDRGDLSGALACAQESGDLEELADSYRALGMLDAELSVRCGLLGDDAASLYNFAAALAERDAEAALSLFYEALARCGPGDEVVFEQALRGVAASTSDEGLAESLFSMTEEL